MHQSSRQHGKDASDQKSARIENNHGLSMPGNFLAPSLCDANVKSN